MSLREIRERLERIVLGQALPTADVQHQTAPNPVALAILASDALSSVAYASEEILIILNTAAIGTFVMFGFSGNAISIPIAIAIAALIAVVTISYRQTIFSNPAGGGGYRVAKENLGEKMAQVTGAALLTDYILTVAVSISAGVANVTSVFPMLFPYRVLLTVGIILAMTLINLRGVKESSKFFAVPTYFFLITMAFTLIIGFIKYLTGSLGVVVGVEAIKHNVLEPISMLLILRAFSSGCTALTGIEAISNDTQLFRQPRANNAAKTLVVMSTILITLFISITFLANAIHAVPSEHQTVISQLARTIHGDQGLGNLGYVLTMIGASIVLFMAANTPFADFPQLAALHSGDGFLPRQLTYRGRRLVFSLGIATLCITSTLLVILTGALVTKLIPLYAIGVFLGFTISQAGMTRRFWRSGQLKPGEVAHGLETEIAYDKFWFIKMLISGAGSFVTFVVMLVFIITKFTSGAWIIVLLIPILVFIFFQIHAHYKKTAARLKIKKMPHFSKKPMIFNGHKHKELAIYFCDSWTKLAVGVIENIQKRNLPMLIIHINLDEKRGGVFRKHSAEVIELNHWNKDLIQVVDAPYRDIYQSITEILRDLRWRYPDVHFQIYIGALRTKFPFSLLHSGTDKFLRDVLMEFEDVSLNVKVLDVAKIPLPINFKVDFDHA